MPEAERNDVPAREVHAGVPVSAPVSADFIVFDRCGFDGRRVRFTAIPGGETLVRQPWMGQAAWDAAQREWFGRFDKDVVIHRCEDGPYRRTADTLGTAGDMSACHADAVPATRQPTGEH